jgi:hypothetical protein
MPSDVIVEPLALYKVLLHAIKHPTTAVNGVLLGAVAGEGGSAAVTVTDAVPVCHSYITLAPVLEAALSQVCCPVCCRKARQHLLACWHAMSFAPLCMSGKLCCSPPPNPAGLPCLPAD